MKMVFLSILLFINLNLCAQEVISTQGETFSNASISLDWTIGETVTETLLNGNIQLTQGFHQPQLMITTLAELKDAFVITVFPNPAEAFIHVNLESLADDLTYQLHDLNGKLLKGNVINDSRIIIPLGGFSAGSYFLIVKHKKEVIRTFKIQKIK